MRIRISCNTVPFHRDSITKEELGHGPLHASTPEGFLASAAEVRRLPLIKLWANSLTEIPSSAHLDQNTFVNQLYTAKRPRLSVEDVLQHVDDSDCSDGDYLDDPDEPITEGSDDEFSDLEDDDDSYDDGDDLHSSHLNSMSSTPNSPTNSQSASTDSQGTSADQSKTQSAQVNHLDLQSFTSVGPTVDISSSPLEVFDLFFTPDLLEEVVEQSNNYANTVMGTEKYDKWAKMTV